LEIEGYLLLRGLINHVKIGFLLNPIAGMGGSVGLGGTDGEAILKEALRRGAHPTAGLRMEETLASLDLEGVEVLSAGNGMGATVLDKFGIKHTVVYRPSEPTGSEDSKAACLAFIKAKADLIIFVGGDGTARDVLVVVGESTSVLGIPAGVKMHSAVFAMSPSSAANLILRFIRGEIATKRSEVMDIDEESYREGRLSSRLLGYLRVPYEASLVQPMKGDYEGISVEQEKEDIADYVAEEMRPETVYILGPGTTLQALARRLGVPKTLLGVDAIKDGELILQDAREKELLSLVEQSASSEIIVTPIGAQGFIFGRGNQQISPSVIRRVGLRHIQVLAAPTKLIETKLLRVDTGDPDLDLLLRGYLKVVVGNRRERVVRVE
jgi:predicted polyphosphate/ATP-dependent NAD kinase